MCAAQWLGAVVVPLYQDATADEIGVLDPERESHPRLCREPGAGRQAARDPAALPVGPMHRLRQGPRHAPLQAAASLSATTRCCKQGRELVAAEARLRARPRWRAASGEDTAFLFFTSGTTGPAKGVVLTHAALIDRARLAAAIGELERHRRGDGLSAAGMDRPEPVRLCPADGRRLLRLLSRILRHHAVRYARDGSDLFPRPRRACWRRCSRRCRCAWRRPAASSSVSTATAWRSRSASNAQRLAGKTVSMSDRLKSFASDISDLRSAARRARDEQGARGLHRRRCDRSRTPDVLPRARHQPEAALRLDRDRLLRRHAARRRQSSRTRSARRSKASN